LLVLSAVAVAGFGCGGEKEGVAAAPPQIIRVDTTELDGEGGVGFWLDVRRLQITQRLACGGEGYERDSG
jgi:hypothetical protein